MNFYRYKAYDYKGKLHRGNLFVNSEEEALSFLLRNNLTPVEVRLIPESLLYNLTFKFFFRLKFNQKIYIFRSLYLILKSGLNLDQGLNILARENKGSVRDFIFYLIYNLYKGEPLYKTFADFPNYFSQVEIETIKSAEISGNLVNNLEKLIENLETQREIKSEIISSLLYPLIVLGLSFGVVVLLITFVMPRIGILLKQLSSQPPLFTRILINLSDFVNANLNLIFILFILLVIIMIILISWKKTRTFLIRYFLKLPLISRIYFNFSLSQSLFILRHLLSSGISLVNALKITAETKIHPSISEALMNVEKEIKTGKNFGEALMKEDKIPAFVSSVLSIASESGFLEETIKVIEKYYLEEFRKDVKRFLNLFQPAILVFLGIVVGFVAVGVLLPIYQQISQQLQIQEGRGQIPGEVR